MSPDGCRSRVGPHRDSELTLRLPSHKKELFTIRQLNKWAKCCWTDNFTLLLAFKVIFISSTPTVIKWNTPEEDTMKSEV